MKQQEIAQILAYAFDLERVADRIHNAHVYNIRKKQQQRQALSASYIMSEDGRPIVELFGYYMKQKLRNKTFCDMGKACPDLPYLFVTKEVFKDFCEKVWPDMGKYINVIPVLFGILKVRDVISTRVIDLFLEICTKQINPFMAEIKQNVPASLIRKCLERLHQQCQREDLVSSGFASKIFVEEIMKKQLKINVPQWPKELYNSNNVNQINYKLLLGPSYLGAGEQVQRFLKSRFVLKIIRALKKAAIFLKGKGNQKKKTGTGRGLRPTKPAEKGKKNQKLLQKYIEQNKQVKKQQVNKNAFMIKPMILDIIESVVNYKFSQSSDQRLRGDKMFKSVYIIQPEYPQVQYDNTDMQIRKVVFAGNNSLGIFISGNKGYILDVTKSLKKSSFQLNLSSIFKQSPIVEYEVYDNIIYLLKANGLLYSWPISGDSFLNQIQTSFSNKKSPPDSKNCDFLKIRDGVVFVNCTHDIYSRFEIYSLELTYIGVVQLNQMQFGLNYKICQQALCLKHQLKKTMVDKKVQNISQYKQLFQKSEPKGDLSLGTMLCQFNQNSLTVNKINQYVHWILSFGINNQIVFPPLIFSNLQNKNYDSETIFYLLKYGYINSSSPSDVQRLKDTINLAKVENRKLNLLALFEDNSLEPLKSVFLTKNQFLLWISPACLMANQLQQLIQTLSYRPDGKVDMSKLFYNEHYRRISDTKYNRYVPERYKTIETPPVCVQQFLPIPNYQIIVFSTCFPIQSNLYVANILNGQLINSFDFSKMISMAPKLSLSDKNGFIFVFAHRTVTLWNQVSFSTTTELAPIKIWENLQSSQIIDLVVLYEISTVVTLTKDCIKIWDFDEMCHKKDFKNSFQLKPGYKAIQTKQSISGQVKNYKKKLYIRENSLSLFKFISPNQMIVFGAVSKSKSSNFYIKAFGINKFNVVINPKKQHYQIPTKLNKQLQSIAVKRKNYPPVTKNNWLTENEKRLHKKMRLLLSHKINSVTKVVDFSKQKPQLQHKVGLLAQSIYSIYNKSMFQQNQQSKRMQNIFKLITIESLEKLQEIIQPKFLELYKANDKLGYHMQRMLEDGLTTKQKKAINRVLYVLSLVQKYSRSLVKSGNKLYKFISSDKNTIDEKLIMNLLPRQLPLDAKVITKAVKIINNLQEPVARAVKIINGYLPTRYRFLIPRYIKQIHSGKPSAELNEYISNRYQNQPKLNEVTDRLKNTKYSSIQVMIQHQKLLSFVKGQMIQIFPQSMNCNYSLIQSLMCLKIITEDEAFGYCIAQSNKPQQRLSSKVQMSQTGDQIYLDQMNNNLLAYSDKKFWNLPHPKVSIHFFKNQIYNGPHSDNFFYGFLQGDKAEEATLSENVDNALKMANKRLSLRYRLSQWRLVMGEKIKLLRPFANQFLQRFPLDYRIVPIMDLRTALMNMIDGDKIYQDIVKRVAYSCTSSEQKINNWKKSNQSQISIEGMWANINHLLRFMEDYNPILLQMEDYSKQNIKFELRIPSQYVIQKLSGDYTLLSKNKFRELLTYNLTPLSLTEMDSILDKYFKYGTKKINIFQIKDMMFKDYSCVGAYLIDKFQRFDFQHRFSIVKGNISSAQLASQFNSKLLANYLFGDERKGLPQQLPFQQISNALKTQVIEPAAAKMAQAFILALPNRMIELLQYYLVKSSMMPVLSLSQLMLKNSNEQAIIMCLLKFITGESNSAQIINLLSLITQIKKKRQISQNSYNKYHQILNQKIRNKNIVKLFLQYGQPQNLPFTDEDPPKSYSITFQHMHQLLQYEFLWFINYRPFANIFDFINHIRYKQIIKSSVSSTINLFCDNCVCKIGIAEIVNLIGVNPSFPQFYSKIKSSFKIMSKVDVISFIELYDSIIKFSQNKLCDANGIRNLCQTYISIHKKMEWICALYDRERITDPLQNEELTLDCELKKQRLKNLFEQNMQSTDKNEEQLKKTLKYQIYLVYKYLNNDPSKIRPIKQCIEEKKVSEARILLQAYGVVNVIHMQQIIKYLSQQKMLSQGKRVIGQDVLIQEIKWVKSLIKDTMFIINKNIKYEQGKQISKIEQQISNKIRKTAVYANFVSSGTGEYYETYHSLLVYCQSIQLSKLATSNNVLKIQSRIRDFLISQDMTANSLYELLNLSTYENIVQYLPEVILEGNQTQDQIQDIIAIVKQFAKPERNGFKYPINPKQFERILSDVNQKSKKSRKQYQYLYSELDILGTGYVNLNEIPKYRGCYPSYYSPYVYIPNHIDYLLQNQRGQSQALPSKQRGPILNPPENNQVRLKIKQKLLKYELPVKKQKKIKLIKVDVCLAILGQFGIADNHQYQQFIKQKFFVNSCQLLDLSGIVDWLFNSLKQQRDQIQRSQMAGSKLNALENLVNVVDSQGGVIAYVRRLKNSASSTELNQMYGKVLNLSELKGQIVSQLVLGSFLGLQKTQNITQLLKNLCRRYFCQAKRWDTLNNSFCREIKNMAQMYYSLVYKFYHAHKNIDMHNIYGQVSEKGELTLNTLWRYIQDKGITGYSRGDINELFSAIDINDDKKLSYLELCQFWMACQQVFDAEDEQKYTAQIKIDEINNEAKNVFVQLCSVQLDNYQQEILDSNDLVKFTNIPNIQKVDYIVKAVNSASVTRGPSSGAMNTKIQMNKSKLKILMKKIKAKQASNLQNLKEDLIISATYDQLGQYVKDGYDFESLCKIVILKYPKLGYQIVQHLCNINGNDPKSIGQKYKSIEFKQSIFEQPKKQKKEVIRELINEVEECNKNHQFRVQSYALKYNGKSIASQLLDEEVNKKFSRIHIQLNQLCNYVSKIDLPKVPLYYLLENTQNHIFEQSGHLQEMLNMLKQYTQQAIIVDKEVSYFRIKKVLYTKNKIQNRSTSRDSMIIKREIQCLNTDLICKSQNKVKLLLHENLYQDERISNIPVNPKNSSRFKITGASVYKPEYVPITSMIPLQAQDKEQLIDRIMSLIRYISQQLAYCYFKHGVTGLLVRPQNVLININQQTEVKFDHFLTAFTLNLVAIKNKQQNVGYVDGIDPKYFMNKGQDFPPEVISGVYNQTIDIYLLAHIVYKIFASQLTNQNISETQFLQHFPNCQTQSGWNWTSQLHQISSQRLKAKDLQQMSQKQYNLWTLFYECSQHDWFMRPRLYQLLQVIDNYYALHHSSFCKQLFSVQNNKEEFIKLLDDNKVQNIQQLMPALANQQWTVEQLYRFRISLKKNLPLRNNKLIQFYNKMLENYAKGDYIDQDPQQMRYFLTILVDYLLMIPTSCSGQCFIANATFKNILNSNSVLRYLSWCDQNWKIEEYRINQKIQKINMNDKLQLLHKNSSYYHDIATLSQCRVTLFESENVKKSETSKKVAISFIYSCLISNNINKIYAVYRSDILKNIYSFYFKQELLPIVISILEIVTSCFNPFYNINRFRAVDEVYKVMMVISNSIRQKQPQNQTLSPQKTNNSKLKTHLSLSRKESNGSTKSIAQVQPVVSMQNFVNNYYTLSGQQCKQIVLAEICRKNICTLPVLTYLMHEVKIERLSKIILNLSFDKESQKMLRSPVIGGYYSQLKQANLQLLINKIKQGTCLHTQFVSLNDISAATFDPQNCSQLIRDHIKFYQWYYTFTKNEANQSKILVGYQRNFYCHYQSLLAKCQKIFNLQIQNAEISQKSLEIIELIIKLHRTVMDVWTKLPCHQDFTSATLRFFMNALQKIYSYDYLYVNKKVNQQVTPDILFILRSFWQRKNNDSGTHDLVQIALTNGFIQFYCNIIKKQHSLIEKYIEKNVENIQLVDNYHPEAEFRLICYYQFLQNVEHSQQICQIMIANQLPVYIIQNMLPSNLTLDLRFYKAVDQLVPFRFCRPLRAEAIAMIGYTLSTPNCILKDDFSSRLIPHLPRQLTMISSANLDGLNNKMRWIESLWLLANIINSQNQRIKYQFINLRLHQILNAQIARYPFLNRFFPEVTQTLRKSQSMISSLARSQLIMDL